MLEIHIKPKNETFVTLEKQAVVMTFTVLVSFLVG